MAKVFRFSTTARFRCSARRLHSEALTRRKKAIIAIRRFSAPTAVTPKSHVVGGLVIFTLRILLSTTVVGLKPHDVGYMKCAECTGARRTHRKRPIELLTVIRQRTVINAQSFSCATLAKSSTAERMSGCQRINTTERSTSFQLGLVAHLFFFLLVSVKT